MSTDPTDPLETARRANRVLGERVAELERQLRRFGEGREASSALGTVLSEREALLAEAERIAHMGSWLWDVNRNQVNWSDELFRIVGLDPAVHSASTDQFFECVHPEDRERVQQASARIVASGISEQVDCRVQRPDGSVRQITMDAALLFDAQGKLQRAVGTVLDVTEARESARTLARTAELLAEAQRIGRMGSFEVTFEPYQLTWSDELFRIVDVERTERPSVELFLQRLHEGDRRRVVKMIERARVQGKVEPGRARILHRDGSIRHVEMMAVALRDERGHVHAIRGTISDVTELVKLEAQFHQSQKMDAIGQLAGGLAHDYNNLLTVILGNAELLLDKADHPELREIISAANTARELTSRLLTFSRQSARRERVVSLADDLGEARGLIERALGDGIEIRVEHGEEPWKVSVDRAQVQQMLLNLALNARDAMPEGGKLTLSTRNRRLSAAEAKLHDARPGEYVSLTVTDTGVGMDESTRSRVFEPFFTTKTPGRGTGLGLAMVFGAMKQCGGFVDVDSQPGQGTTFALWFPRATHEISAGEPSTGGANERQARVLLVEDNPMVARVTRLILESNGYSVRLAPGPEPALAMWEQDPADVLVTDVEMPGMSGLRLSERLRPRTPDLRVLFMTGYSSAQFNLHTSPGRSEVLLKPFRGDELISAVNRLLASR